MVKRAYFAKVMFFLILCFLPTASFLQSSEKIGSELDRMIPAEVKRDSFYKAIKKLARQENITTILEIGSSSGDGSTQAFVSGIVKNPSKPTLFCMEVSKTRFRALKKRYRNESQVKCYNVSSVPLESFAKEGEVRTFFEKNPTSLNQYGLDCVLHWLQQDLAYVKSADVPQQGIEMIKKDHHIENFGIVLIDGSEFTGMAELKLVYGAKFILLDDINAFKNYTNYRKLLVDPNYRLIKQDWELRNGYAIFKRND